MTYVARIILMLSSGLTTQVNPRGGFVRTGAVMRSKRYWFPAKTYGWGWGLPQTWEGWLVTVAYFALLGLAMLIFLRSGQVLSFNLAVLVLSLALVGVCWWKGEPPRWRWGK